MAYLNLLTRFKRAAKYAFLLVLIFVFTVLCLSAFSTKPYVEIPRNDVPQTNELTKVYVVNHGWHTGLVVPSSVIQSKLRVLKTRFPKTPYIEFGWGDKGFYQSKEITTGLTLRAIFWPTESVVHAVAVPVDVVNYFSASEVKALCLNRAQHEALMTFIANSFAKDEQDKVQIQKTGIYGDSQFYTGVGSYSLVNTCNKWTAKGLKSAGQDISTTVKLTAGSVMNYMQAHAESEALCFR